MNSDENKILRLDGTKASEDPRLALASARPPEQTADAIDPAKPVTIQPHKSGYPLMFTEVLLKPGKYALFDGTGRTFGVVNHSSIAQMICEALKLVADAHRTLPVVENAKES